MDESLEFAKKNKQKFIEEVIEGNDVKEDKVAIFMAGSPGSGKTETAIALTELIDNLCV
jgi:type I site-specific restriction endonuclease